jgi:hypothetical protein
MKHNKYVTNAARDRENKKKSMIYFQWFRSCTFFNEALQPRFFAKKMTGQKR